MASQPGRDRLHIPQGVAQAAGAPRRRRDIEAQAGHRLDPDLAEQQALGAAIDQLGSDTAVAPSEAEILQLQGGNDLAGIGEEEPAAQPGNLEQEIAEDVVADIGHAEELPQHGQNGPIQPQHPQELPEGSGPIALQQRQQQGRGAEAGLARGTHIGIAMDGGEGEFVVLHGVDLAVEQVGGEVEAARHRQAGILQAITKALGQQQAVGTSGHHHMAGPQFTGGHRTAGPRSQPNPETIPFRLDRLHHRAEPQIKLTGGTGELAPGLGHKGFGQGFVIHRRWGVADADRHNRLGAELAVYQGHPRLPFGDRLGLQQFHGRKMGRKLLETAAQQGALSLPHRQHHLRRAEHAAIAHGRVEELAVAADHRGGALHAEGLLQGVVGLDIAAVDGLTVAAGPRIHLGQPAVALDQGQAG